MRIVSYDFDNKNFHLVGFTSVNKKGYRTYSVPSEKSDEFVMKYNSQSKFLSRFVVFSTLACAIAGISKKGSFINNVFKSFLGAVYGFLISSFCVYKLNGRLMDKYEVKDVNR